MVRKRETQPARPHNPMGQESAKRSTPRHTIRRMLTPADVLHLQRTIGNAAVGRIMVQRRLPDIEVVKQLINDNNAERARIQLKKLEKEFKRTFARCTQEQRLKIAEICNVAELKTPGSIKGDPKVALVNKIKITKHVLQARPLDIVYPGREKRLVAPEGQAAKNLLALVAQAKQLLEKVSNTSEFDENLKQVFGDDTEFGWQKAKLRFVDAGAWLEKLAAEHKIGADQSGVPEFLGFEAKTNFQKSITISSQNFELLKKDLFPGSSVPQAHELEAMEKNRNRLLIVLMHESFHAAHRDVKDESGYHGEGLFATRTPQEKYTNAAHYEEIMRRMVGFGPTGGTFVPAVKASDTTDKSAVTMDIVGEGKTLAARELGKARILSVSALTWLTESQEHQATADKIDATRIKRLLKLSAAAGWTLHRRAVSEDALPPVTELDIVLAESVARAILDTLKYIHTSAPASSDAWPSSWSPYEQNTEAIRDIIIAKSLEHIGPIRKNITRDKFMVTTMARLYDEVKGG